MPAAVHQPRLFTLRLWQAPAPDDPDALEWRGKVQSLPDGEAYYFRNWPGMIEYLQMMLRVEPAASTASENRTE